MSDIRATIEQAISLAGPINDTTAAVHAVEAVVRKAEARGRAEAADALMDVSNRMVNCVDRDHVRNRADALRAGEPS